MNVAPAVDMERVGVVLDKFEKGEQSSLIHLLQDLQSEIHYLPTEAIRAAAEYLDVPLNSAFSVATFYKAFSLVPRGETIVKVCLGTSCHIRGAPVVVEDLRIGLGVGPGETTPDMKYTVEVVNCVGACALAPVVIADKRYIAEVKPGTIVEILEEG